MDPNVDSTKVFLGGLLKSAIKPVILEALEQRGAPKPVDVFVCEPKSDQHPRIAFVQYANATEASVCILVMNGVTDSTLTSNAVKANNCFWNPLPVMQWLSLRGL